MTLEIDDFFIYSNTVKGISREEYAKLELILSSVKAFCRSTYQSVYLIDYFKKDFPFVSDSMGVMFGLSAEEIEQLGYKLFIDYVPKEEQAMLVEINSKGFEFFEKIPAQEREEWTISYNFHIISNNKQRLINLSITPILLANDGRMWIGMCTISLASTKKVGNVIMKRADQKSYFEYTFDDKQWHKSEGVTISDTEKEVLILSAQGYTMGEIAKKIHKSVDSVKSYKRNIFEKLEVCNITEAIIYATNYKLI